MRRRILDLSPDQRIEDAPDLEPDHVPPGFRNSPCPDAAVDAIRRAGMGAERLRAEQAARR